MSARAKLYAALIYMNTLTMLTNGGAFFQEFTTQQQQQPAPVFSPLSQHQVYTHAATYTDKDANKRTQKNETNNLRGCVFVEVYISELHMYMLLCIIIHVYNQLCTYN